MLRFFGVVGLVFGVALAALDLTAAGRLRALGEWWFSLAPNSLQLLQPAVERHVARWLWDPVILSVLETPAALLLGGVGVVLLLLSIIWRQKIKI